MIGEITKQLEWSDAAFSLECLVCDAGQEIDSEFEAIARGWTELELDLDGLGWTVLGVCPDCRDYWNR